MLIKTSQICYQKSIWENLSKKICQKNLSKHTNSFYKVYQENNSPICTDVNSKNNQLFVWQRNQLNT